MPDPVQTAWIRDQPTDDALRAWDWRAALDERGAPLTWLARQTNRAAVTVYRYSDGSLTPPLDWLRAAARALGWSVTA